MKTKIALFSLLFLTTGYSLYAQQSFTRNIIPDSLIDLSQINQMNTEIKNYPLESFDYLDDNHTLYISDLQNSYVIAINLATFKIDTLGLGRGRGPQQFVYLNMLSFSKEHIYLSDGSLNKYVRYKKSDHSFDGEFLSDNFSPYLAFRDNEIANASYIVGKGAKLYDSTFNTIKNIEFKLPNQSSSPYDKSGYVVSLNGDFYYFTQYKGVLYSEHEDNTIELEAYKQSGEGTARSTSSVNGVFQNNNKRIIDFLYTDDQYVITRYSPIDNSNVDFYVDYFSIDGSYLASVDYANIIRRFRDLYGSYVNGSARFYNEYIFLTTEEFDKYTIVHLKDIYTENIKK